MVKKGRARRSASGTKSSSKPLPRYAQEIRALRGKQSRAEFARRLRVGLTAVAGWERGLYSPSANKYLKLGNMTLDVGKAQWFWEQAGLDVKVLRVIADKLLSPSIEPTKASDASLARVFRNAEAPPTDGDEEYLSFPKWMVRHEWTTTYIRLS